jgi:signal peptidase
VALLDMAPGISDFTIAGNAVRPVSSLAAFTPARTSRDGIKRGLIGKLLNGAGTLLVIGAVLVFLFLAVGPRFLGYQTATMLTGSMAPSIVPGDVVVTTQQPVSGVTVGDVISYHIPVEDHRVETHRVVEVTTNPDGTTAVRTKGDANEAVDPWIATLEGDYLYEEAFVIPGIGNIIRVLRTPAVSTILVYGAPTVLVLGLLSMIWSRPATKNDTNDNADADADVDSDTENIVAATSGTDPDARSARKAS